MQMNPASPLVSTTPPYGQPLGLADRLREATQEVHEQAMAPRLVQSVLPLPSIDLPPAACARARPCRDLDGRRTAGRDPDA